MQSSQLNLIGDYSFHPADNALHHRGSDVLPSGHIHMLFLRFYANLDLLVDPWRTSTTSGTLVLDTLWMKQSYSEKVSAHVAVPPSSRPGKHVDETATLCSSSGYRQLPRNGTLFQAFFRFSLSTSISPTAFLSNLEVPRLQPLKDLIRIPPPTDLPQPPSINLPIPSKDILLLARIILVQVPMIESHSL